MNNFAWKYTNPVEVVSGQLEHIGDYINLSNVLLVTSAGFNSRGVVSKVRDALADRNVFVCDEVSSNPDLVDLDKISEKFINSRIGAVIGLGGGSAIDAAKVLSVLLANPHAGTLEGVFRLGHQSPWVKRLPLLIVPTTSGTGSEVTPFATVWDKRKCKKYSLAGSFVFPDVAFLDPSLTITLGYYETLYPALDAISHALESLWNKNKNIISETFAVKALKIANGALPKVLKTPEMLSSRIEMQVASTLSGLAISQTRTALAHSISYPLTARYDVPHGLACGFTLSRLINYYLEKNRKCEHESLLRETHDLVSGLNLDNLLLNYIGVEDLIRLSNEMFTTERSDNFSVELPNLIEILLP